MAEQKIELTDEQVGAVAAKVFDKMGRKEKGTRAYFSDSKLQDKYENTENIWRNNGFENSEDQFDATKKDQKIGFKELCDALSTPDASILIGKVVSNIVKEAIEPLLVGTSLLHTIRFSAGQQITFPAAGAFTAEDIPEGGELNFVDSSPRMVTFYNKNSSELRETPESSRYFHILVKILEIGQSAANPFTGGGSETKRGALVIMGKTYEKYYINESIFEVLDEKTAYILGVIFSDGNIEKDNSRLCISSKDFDWLKNISYIFGNPPIRKRSNNLGEWYVLSINRKKIVSDLMKYGITQNKSLTMKFPELNIDSLRHFIRGYFDGDGHIGYNKKRGYEIDFACGSESFSKSLVDILNKHVYNGFHLYHKRKNYWNIRGFNRCWKEFSEYIYKDATIYLPRKRLDDAIVQSLKNTGKPGVQNDPERKLEVAGTVNIVAVFKSYLIGLKLHDVDNKAEGESHRERLNDETLEFSDVIVRSAW